MTIGQNIRRLREQNGMTQADLAQALGITHGAVSLWESDKRSPSVKQADKIAAALGVRLIDLFEEE